MKENLVRDESYVFAVQVVRFCRELRGRNEHELARQLLRSGTSIGANIEEALAGISRADCLAKMAIASKEARESRYWLRLLRDSDTVEEEKVATLLHKAEDLINILTAIVKSTAASKVKK
jgi:four helix bundle protein